MAKCPGQDQRFWKPEDIFEIKCPNCSKSLEFWKDDPQVRCKGCNKIVTNPNLDISCAKWCKYAKECLGVSSINTDSILCNALVEDIRQMYQGDKKRIDTAEDALKFAELILMNEGGNPLVVKAAAILCKTCGCADSEQSDSDDAAREVLTTHGVDAGYIENITEIINALNNDFEIDSLEYRIVADARRLTGFYNESAGKSKDEIEDSINKTFNTSQAKQLARQLFE